MNKSFLTREILEESHNAKEYLQWVKGLIAKVKLEPNGLELVRLGKGPAKELMNEALPIGLLVTKYFNESADVLITLKIGNQNYDAVVSDYRKTKSPITHIEVTMAHEGEEEHLRNVLLHEYGEVSGLSKPLKIKKESRIDEQRELVSQSEVIKRESEVLTGALERKLDKNYPKNTLLLVAFNDEMAFDRSDNIQNLELILDKYIPKLKSFQSIVIIGLQNGLYIERNINNSGQIFFKQINQS